MKTVVLSNRSRYRCDFGRNEPAYPIHLVPAEWGGDCPPSSHQYLSGDVGHYQDANAAAFDAPPLLIPLLRTETAPFPSIKNPGFMGSGLP
jgi:hypothetical protein